MITTKEWISKWYNYFNKIYFEGLLPQEGDPEDEYTIELLPIKKKVGYLGQCRYRNNHHVVLVLNNKYDWLIEIEWQNVLLHEMIHVWQGVMGYKGGHGTTFKKKANQINSFGWGITTKYDGFREINNKNIID